jgi:hypothetical protein
VKTKYTIPGPVAAELVQHVRRAADILVNVQLALSGQIADGGDIYALDARQLSQALSECLVRAEDIQELVQNSEVA